MGAAIISLYLAMLYKLIWYEDASSNENSTKASPCPQPSYLEVRYGYIWSLLHAIAFLTDIQDVPGCGGDRRAVLHIHQKDRESNRPHIPTRLHPSPAVIKKSLVFFCAVTPKGCWSKIC